MKNPNHAAGTPPLAIGMGLLTLDVVFTGSDPPLVRQWAGGTCGNVLLALRFLGWRALPIARFRDGEAARHVLSDLRAWGISTEFVSLSEDGSTPVIMHRIGRTASGEPYHTFSWRCPKCGTRLPGYKPVLASDAKELIDRLETPEVFFFDRLSRGAIVLAQEFAERGAVVVFEPSTVGNPVLFRDAWRLAHIVKYSHERLQELPADLDEASHSRLQVETLGRDGLRYRSRLSGCRTTTWQRLKALAAENIRDTAGSGDWCTAGIIHRLLSRGRAGLKAVTDQGLREAIRYGQALAAWNCGFEGARGGMYSVDKELFKQQVKNILNGDDNGQYTADIVGQGPTPNPIVCLCPSSKKGAAPDSEVRGGHKVVTKEPSTVSRVSDVTPGRGIGAQGPTASASVVPRRPSNRP